MIENILPVNYFSKMVGAMIDTTILCKLLKAYLPELYKSINDQGYELNLNNLVYKWFMSMYSQGIPEEVSSARLIILAMLFNMGRCILRG
jgi:hypothetical protein